MSTSNQRATRAGGEAQGPEPLLDLIRVSGSAPGHPVNISGGQRRAGDQVEAAIVRRSQRDVDDLSIASASSSAASGNPGESAPTAAAHGAWPSARQRTRSSRSPRSRRPGPSTRLPAAGRHGGSVLASTTRSGSSPGERERVVEKRGREPRRHPRPDLRREPASSPRPPGEVWRRRRPHPGAWPASRDRTPRTTSRRPRCSRSSAGDADRAPLERREVEPRDVRRRTSPDAELEHLVEVAVVEPPVPADREGVAAHHAARGGRVERAAPAAPCSSRGCPSSMQPLEEAADRHVGDACRARRSGCRAARSSSRFHSASSDAWLPGRKAPTGLVTRTRRRPDLPVAVADRVEPLQRRDRVLVHALAALAVGAERAVVRQRARPPRPGARRRTRAGRGAEQSRARSGCSGP